MATVKLPIIKMGDKSFFVDKRLKQICNVKNPHEFYPIINCEICDEITISDIKTYKEVNCTTSCEQFLNKKCRGQTEDIELCKDCCEDDFLACGGGRFYG